MHVYRMKDGNLWCHSVVALNEQSTKQLEALGKPKVR